MAITFRFLRGFCAALPIFLFSTAAPAAEGPAWNVDTLTGDWRGLRSDWSARGVVVEVVLKADVLSNLSGGIKRGTTYMDNWDIKLGADAETLWGWNNTTAFLQLISNHGGKLNTTHVGSFMGVDNIEVPANTTKLFHAWLARSFFDGKFSLLAGLYPVDSQFHVTDSTAIFLHPTGGMAAEVAQTGVNGPSIFPTSSFGFRAMWQPAPAYYFQAALVDGVPGDPNNRKGTHIRFDRGDGSLAIMEAGIRPTVEISKYALGYWRYTPRFNDLIDTVALGNPLRRVNRGAYFLAEQTVFREKDDASQGLTLFFRYGVANGDVNTLDYSNSMGLRYKGLLPGRDEDEFGIGLSRGHAGAKAATLASNETALEVTYRAKAAPWFTIQPVLQYIANPGHDPALRHAWIGGVRFEVAF